MPQTIATKSHKLRKTTQRRHEIVREWFNHFYSMKVEGMLPDYDEVIRKVSETTGYSERTVKEILKR